jgi:hypothetical protein
VGGAADADDEQAKGAGGQRGAGKIEGVGGARRRRQRLEADPKRDQAEGNIDGEQPAMFRTPKCRRRSSAPA